MTAGLGLLPWTSGQEYLAEKTKLYQGLGVGPGGCMGMYGRTHATYTGIPLKGT